MAKVNERRRVEDAAVRLNRNLQILSRCNRVLFQARGEQELLQSICQILVETAALPLVWIGYCEDDPEQTVRPVARAGDGLDYLERVKVSWGHTETGQGPVGEAIRTGRFCRVEDIRTDPKFSHERNEAVALGYGSCLVLPLIADLGAQGSLDLRGALVLYARAQDAFDENEVELYADLASYLTCAVTRVRSSLADDVTLGVNALRTREDRKRALVERRRAEEALRESEFYLAEAQRLSHTGSWAWAPLRGEIRYWSEECFRVLGFEPQEVPPRFEDFFNRIHPDDQPRVKRFMEAATRDRAADFALDYRIVHPGGRIRDIHVVGHPVFDASGELAEVVGTVIDWTERKQADEERQAALSFLESMDKINQAIHGTNDLEQMASDVLEAVLSIFACDRAWLVYPCDPEAPSWRAAMERYRPDYPGAFALGVDLPMDAEVANVFRTARASGGAVQFGSTFELPVPAQLAERFGIQSLIGVAVYPKIDKPYMFGLHQCSYPRVWTAREERLVRVVGLRLGDALTGLLMLRNLRESENRLADAQRIAHVGHWELDLDTDRYVMSDEMGRIFGLRPREKDITRAMVREMIHPEDLERVTRAAMRTQEGGPPYDEEYRVVRPDGEVRIVHARADVMRDESGRPRRRFGTVQDVTERKRAEEELRESERRYREAQTELAHVNRVATMGQLTASIAHEVKQPITAAVTSADAGLRWLAARPPDLEEVRNAFDDVVRAGTRAGEVIDHIGALIKKVAARNADLDVNETILETIALTRSEMQQHRVLLQTELADGLPRIWGDRVQLQQVLLNLIMNAIEAMGEVSEGSRELLIGTSAHAPDGVIVAVRDSGPGLKPESLEHLFDPFYTTKPAGMGMGLSICRSITEAHGGRLWATANSPRGAVFQFTVHATGGDPS
jgi:PAS domain S-box-containing protein